MNERLLSVKKIVELNNSTVSYTGSYHNHHESLICFLTSSKNGSIMGLGNYANFQMDELPGIYNNISALHSGCSQEQPLF